MSFNDLTEEQKASLKGDKGDRGFSGVYVGAGEMPDDCNVQIDTTGATCTTEELVAAVLASLPIYNGEVEDV